MLFKADVWPRLANGSITVAFRRWKRPTVKAGGTLQSPAGLLAIETVDRIGPDDITDADARRAGDAGRAAVLAALGPDVPDRALYRITFHHAGVDPRVALRQQNTLEEADVADLTQRLGRLDAHSADGQWTHQVLRLIADHPAVRAPDLAQRMGDETPRFKRRVRRLKALGLTESLQTGYRLSPRGQTLLDRTE